MSKAQKRFTRAMAQQRLARSQAVKKRINKAGKPGSLHAHFKIEHGEKIPITKLRKLAKSSHPLARKAMMVLRFNKKASPTSRSDRMKKAWQTRKKLYGPKGKKR